MRDRFLGDSLDMSKRVAACLLREAGFSLCICPLPSQADFAEPVYRSCLGLDDDDMFFYPPILFRASQRTKYLAALRDELPNWKPNNAGIVILDPDKGVHDSKESNLFITVAEIRGLVNSARQLMFAVYHHKNAGRISCHELIDRFLPYPTVAYDFGAAVLCFVCAETEKPQIVADVFHAQLNPARILLSRTLRLTCRNDSRS